MKVLHYAVFKDLAAIGYVARDLVDLSPFRPLASCRTLRLAAISLKISADRERGIAGDERIRMSVCRRTDSELSF